MVLTQTREEIGKLRRNGKMEAKKVFEIIELLENELSQNKYGYLCDKHFLPSIPSIGHLDELLEMTREEEKYLVERDIINVADNEKISRGKLERTS